MRSTFAFVVIFAIAGAHADGGGDEHSHPAPEKLGTVHFETSCAVAVQGRFDRAVALLHSFAYDPAAREFRAVATEDAGCAMAHWGIAMSAFHQLWSPPGTSALQLGREELAAARRISAGHGREREWIEAAVSYFSDTDPAHHPARARRYEEAMRLLARHYPGDDEAQVFYALALISTAAPTDRSHSRQKRAAAILEPIYRRQPDHPGVAHYLIHAYDSEELAPRGLAAARAYAKIAPSAPHALHMPSHIFTRLGLWDESIESNQAARRAAHEQEDIGEELHAMDYLTYAYLQRGRDGDAEQVVQALRAMGPLPAANFKVAYAATAMPVRLAIERHRWSDATAVEPLPGSAPYPAAIAHWARALGQSRSGHPDRAAADVAGIDACENQSRAAGDTYWASQIQVLSGEARAWSARAAGRDADAVALLRTAADVEDALEKLPVTPGPIVPAREQLGELLLDLQRPGAALRELTRELKGTPGRRSGLEAAVRAAQESGHYAAAARWRRTLRSPSDD
jgi:tetratricopeptide (TPR) repeat protein